jgi:hypothetical protein
VDSHSAGSHPSGHLGNRNIAGPTHLIELPYEDLLLREDSDRRKLAKILKHRVQTGANALFPHDVVTSF